MDTIPELLETPVAILTVVTATTALLTFAFDSTALARQYPDAYQRIAGVVLVIVGGGLAVAAVWQVRLELPLRWGTPTYGTGGMFAAGLLVLAYGVWRVRRAPASEEVNRIKRVARGVLAYLDSGPVLSPFDTGDYVELPLQRRASSRRKVPAIRALARVGRYPTVLYGSLATGKSTVLRRLARVSCEAAQHKRRPRWLAIYVDLRDPTLLSGSLTPDALREHIAEMLGATDGLVRDAVSEVLVQQRRARCRLLLLFDSLEALGDAGSVQVEAGLDAIRRLVDDNASLRAVVATRDHALVNRAAWPVRRFSPFCERQQLAFIRAAGLARPLWMLHRLRGRGDMDTLLTSPLLLSLLCRHLARYPQDVRADLDGYRLLDETVDQMLGAEDEQARRAAAELARHMPGVGFLPLPEAVAIVSAVAPQPLASAAVDVLLACGLLRLRTPGVVEFPHRIFRDFFATQWLLSRTDIPQAKALLADPSWRLPMVAALQHGTAKLVDELLEAAKSILVDAATNTDVVDDVAPYLSLEPSAHITSGFRNFRWTPETYQALRLISDCGAMVPEEIRVLSSRLVVSAFIHGTRVEQLKAVELIPSMTGQAGAWITRRVYHSRPALGSDFVDSVTRVLLDAPHVFAALSPYGRLEAITVTSTSNEATTIGLARAVGITSDTGTLPGTLRNVLSVLQIAAAIATIAAAFQLVSALASREWLEAGLLLLLVILTSRFLVGAALRIPPPTWMYQLGIASAVFAFAVGMFVALPLPILLLANPGALVGRLVTVGVLTWPGALLLQVSLGVAPRGWHRVLPQPGLVVLVSPMVQEKVLARLPTLREQLTFSATMRGVRRRLFPTLVIGAVLATGVVDIPNVQGEQENNVRAYLVFGIIAAALVIARVRNRLASALRRKRFAVLIDQGTMSGRQVLDHLYELDRSDDVGRLLDDLARAPHQVLHPIAEVLADLADALDHISRLVSQDTKSPIPPAVWDYAPCFRDRSFPVWLARFDEKHRGRLAWLAAQHCDKATLAAKRAASPPYEVT